MPPSVQITPTHVRAAIDAARAVLRDLEPDETPSNLRRIGASSARRLPPPLARALLVELADDAWFREKVVATSEDWNVESPDRDLRASSLLLLQPTGWEEAIADVGADLTSRDTADKVRTLERHLATRESELASARAKIKQLTRTLEQERQAAARRLSEARAAVVEQRRPDLEIAEMRGSLEERSVENDQLRDDIRDADARIDRLKSDLLKARRSRATQGDQASRSWGGSDPLELARQLDALAASVMPEAVLAGSPPTPSSLDRRFDLPAGLSPDSPASIDWLVRRERPTTVIVDGYNVTWLMDPASFATTRARTELLRRLARLKRATAGPMRILAVFDSQHGTIEPSHGNPVEVRFAPSADDEIRRLALETDGDVVVISTDREVREGSEGRQVLVLWSEALVGWRF